VQNLLYLQDYRVPFQRAETKRVNDCKRIVTGILFAAWLCCGGWVLSCANAVALDEPQEPRAINTTAAPSKTDIDVPLVPQPPITPRKIYPPLPADPVYDIVKKWREAEAAGKLNVLPTLVGRGETTAGKGSDWRFPDEEISVVTRPSPAARNGAEPDTARLPSDAEDAEKAIETNAPPKLKSVARAVVPSVVKAPPSIIAAPRKSNAVDVPGEPRLPMAETAHERTMSLDTVPVVGVTAMPQKSAASGPKLNPADPEAGRFIDATDASEKVLPATAKRVEIFDPSSVIRPLAAKSVRDEMPRIESGSGLDRDDPKPAALVRVDATENSALPDAASVTQQPIDRINSALEASRNSVTLPSGERLIGNSAPPTDVKWSAKDVAQDPKAASALDPITGARGKQPAAAAATANGKSIDPELRTAQLLQEIAEKQKHYAELLAEANKRLTPIVNPNDGSVIRGDHERKVWNAMDAKRPLGAISVKVFDAKTKQPLPSRVCMIDATEAAARAPLFTGFWCRGVTPGINVVSGLVRVEINHGGRFFPTFVKGVEAIAGKVLPVEIPMQRAPQLDFAARGWVMADLDIGIRKQTGENTVWFGAPPTINDLILGARAEGVRIVGVSLPLGDENAMNQVRAALDAPNPDVLLIPVFPGPKNLFHGVGAGLGVTSWDGMRATSALPELPLREGFEAIRARGGLAVFKSLTGMRSASIDAEILPLYRRLKEKDYFSGTTGSQARLYSGAEFPFDTVTGAYDVLAFDGSDEMEAVWFNLLNEGAPVRVIGAGGGSLEGGRIPFGQTFLQIEGKPTRENAMLAISEGRTMVSYGPAAFCKVYERDMGPGSVLPTDGRQLHFQIRAFSTMAPGAQIDKVEIIRNGKVVYTQTAAEGESEIQDFRWPMTETANAWYIVRVTERYGHNSALKYRRAWTSPIFFRNSAALTPDVCVSRVHGTMRRGLTPVRGVVTALATGMPTQRVESGPDGSYSIALPSQGTLIFEAPDCEPVAKRIFEHTKVQNGVGKLMTSRDLAQKLADRPIFGLWRLLLSDLDWDITLSPVGPPPEPPRIPEPN